MPDDFRLQYKGTDANWDFVTWNTQGGRDWAQDFRYSIAGPPTMGFNGQRNTATYPFRFNLYSQTYDSPTQVNENLKRAIANILGYATVHANPGDPCARYLDRRMPLKDPDGLGMIAESVGPLTFSNNSGYYPQGSELGMSNFANGTFQKIPSNRSFDDRFVPDNRGKYLYNYAYASVTFAQTYYPVITDQQMLANANFHDERARYMYSMEEPSFEYVNLPQAVLKWSSAGVPASIADKPLMNAGGIIRNISSIKVYWFRLPASAMLLLIPRWKALLGTVNDALLGLPIYGDVIDYDPETLLFVPWRTKLRLAPHGFVEYDVELNWLYRGGIGNNNTFANWNSQIYVDGSYYRVGWDIGVGQTRDIYPQESHENAFSINDINLCGSS